MDNLTIDNNTFASNPGNTKLNPFVWIRYNFLHVFLLTGSLLGFAWLSYDVLWWWLIGVFLSLAVNFFYWVRKKEQFRSGDSNAGLVVSVNPTLVAVTTDLTKGGGEYPVVKIIKYKKSASIGDKIATVALYIPSDNEHDPHWEDFFPTPMDYATTNKADIQGALNSYDPQQWEDLQRRLKQVPFPYAVGLYKVDVEASDWKK
ncbi:MAG: DUF3239 domain-containing protein [Bacteroidota bacterium]